MNKEAASIYDSLYEKEASVFRRSEAKHILDLLERYMGKGTEALEALKDIEKNQGWFRKLMGKSGIQPFGVDAESVVQKYLPGYIKELQTMKNIEFAKHLKSKLTKAEEVLADKANILARIQAEKAQPSKKMLIGAGLGGAALGLGGGGLAAHSMYKSKLDDAEKDRLRAAAQGLGIGMALPYMEPEQASLPRVSTLEQMAYPEAYGY